MREVVTYARMGYLNGYLENAIYYFIEYRSSLEQYIEVKHVRNKIDDPLYEQYLVASAKSNRNFFNSFLYFSLFLEAYIYDYAARRLGDTYTKNYLEKLDIISKWVIIPRLITGRQIDTYKKSFAVLKQLIGVRNKLVHHKTQEATLENVMNFKDLDEQISLTDVVSSIQDIFQQLQNNENTYDNHLFFIRALQGFNHNSDLK